MNKANINTLKQPTFCVYTGCPIKMTPCMCSIFCREDDCVKFGRKSASGYEHIGKTIWGGGNFYGTPTINVFVPLSRWNKTY